MGTLMVEFVQQDEEGASPFRDMYAPGQEGLHHVAMMVDSLADTYAYCREAGLEIASKAQTTSGVEFAFVDTVKSLGHMIEIYERSESAHGLLRIRSERLARLGRARSAAHIRLTWLRSGSARAIPPPNRTIAQINLATVR